MRVGEGLKGKGDKNCGLTEFSSFGNWLDVTDKSGAEDGPRKNASWRDDCMGGDWARWRISDRGLMGVIAMFHFPTSEVPTI